MIEYVKSKKNQSVIKWNQRHLCSSVDPVKEAELWVENQIAIVMHAKFIFVLGVGCGYHLVALKNKFPLVQIVAIDIISDFINFSKLEHNLGVSDIQFLNFTELSALNKELKLKSILKDTYAVVNYKPAQITDNELYIDISLFLLARSEEGFNYLLDARSDLRDAFQIEKLREVEPGCISIKTLEKIVNKNKSATLLLLALREMVN